MNKKIRNIIIVIIILAVIGVATYVAIKYIKSKETVAEIKPAENKTEENILVIGMDGSGNQTEEPEPEPEPEPEKDASTLTQNLYNMNAEIGTLYIPKTKLNNQIKNP